MDISIRMYSLRLSDRLVPKSSMKKHIFKFLITTMKFGKHDSEIIYKKLFIKLHQVRDEITEFGRKYWDNRASQLWDSISSYPVFLSQERQWNFICQLKFGIDIPLESHFIGLWWKIHYPGNHIHEINFSSDGGFYFLSWMRESKVSCVIIQHNIIFHWT